MESNRIVKSLVFEVDGQVVVALVGGADQVDESRLADAARWRYASPRRRRGSRRDRIRGRGRAAVRLTPRPAAYIDSALIAEETVWAAAGTGRDVFEVEVAELVRLAGAVVVGLRA